MTLTTFVQESWSKTAWALGESHRDEDSLSDWEVFSPFLTLLLLWQQGFGPRPHVIGPTLTSMESSCPSSCYCQLVETLIWQGAWVKATVSHHTEDAYLVCPCTGLFACVCFQDFWGHVYDLASDITILYGLPVILDYLHVDFPLTVWVLEGDKFQFPKETSGWAWRSEPTDWSHCQSLKAMFPTEREDKGKRTLKKAKAVRCALMIHVSLTAPFEGSSI